MFQKVLFRFSCYFLVLVFCLQFQPLYGAIKDDKEFIGKQAPLLRGKKAIGRGLLSLDKLMKEYKGLKKDKNGKPVAIWKHNVVVLNFFSTDCIPCMKEIPTYNKLAKKYENKDVKMIYINVEADVNPVDLRLFVARKNIRVPMMIPDQRVAVKSYNAYRLPRLVIINKQQKIEHIITGFNENLDQEISTIVDRLLK